MKFRKKPVVIEAVQYLGPGLNVTECELFVGKAATFDGREFRIKTEEGVMTASPGDWIIRGVQGEFYPCKPDIFEETYEPAASPPQGEAVHPDTVCMDWLQAHRSYVFGCPPDVRGAIAMWAAKEDE
jgi:hypothetical protein